MNRAEATTAEARRLVRTILVGEDNRVRTTTAEATVGLLLMVRRPLLTERGLLLTKRNLLLTESNLLLMARSRLPIVRSPTSMEKSPIATSDPAVTVVVISVVRTTTVEAAATTTVKATATTTVRSPRTAAADPLFPFSAAAPIKKTRAAVHYPCPNHRIRITITEPCLSEPSVSESCVHSHFF